MRFMLQLRGPLPSVGRNKHQLEKHAIRLQVHDQLKELWKVDRTLSKAPRDEHGDPRADPAELKKDSSGLRRLHWIQRSVPHPGEQEVIVRRWRSFTLEGHRFIPLMIYEPTTWLCQLDIRFLRRGEPGGVIHSDGDIDNRLKLLFDALRMPREAQEIFSAGTYPDPCFCLLEDDALISSVAVTTHTLLEPVSSGHGPDEAVLFIEVTVEDMGLR